MSNRKYKFVLEVLEGSVIKDSSCTIEIIGFSSEHKPYVCIDIPKHPYLFIKDKDLEKFAVNILKSLNSKKLKSYTDWKPVHRKINSH